MNRLLSIIASLTGAFALAAPASDNPDVLFIILDDQNDMLGCYGDNQAKTPNIDAFAATAVRFDRSYCPTPLCNPSRTAILTGLRATTTGVYENDFHFRDAPHLKKLVTLPQHLRKHGYTSLAGGKVFHKSGGKFADPESWDKIYQTKTGTVPPPASKRWQHGMKGDFKLPYYSEAIDWAALDIPFEKTHDAITAQRAADILSKPHDKPLFLAVGIFRPHLPWYAPKEFFDLHPLDSIKLPEVMEGDLDDCGPTGQKFAGGDAHKVITEHGKWKEAVRAYLACSSYADACVGLVLDALEKSPRKDNTIVILCTDHGFHLGEKEHWEKYTLWERACRTPLMIRVPGMTKPSVCERTVNLIDLFPTITELCKVPTKEDNEGISLVPLLRDPALAWQHPSLMTHYPGNHAMVDERFRYIRYNDGFEELYDHKSDPNEFTNLLPNPSRDAQLDKLRKPMPPTSAPWVDGPRTINPH